MYVPAQWLLNNNFNAATCEKDRVYLSSGGWLGNTSVWMLPLDKDRWYLVGGTAYGDWPELPNVIGETFQWIYRMIPYKAGLLVGMAGHEGAAQLWRWTPN